MESELRRPVEPFPVRLADEPAGPAEALDALCGGDRGRSAALCARYTLDELLGATPEEWEERLGVDARTAVRLEAAVRLGARAAAGRATRARRPVLRSARRVFDLLRPEFAGIEQEQFVALLLDGKHRLKRVVRVSVGTLTTSLVHPREVFRPAIRGAAAAVIVAHNHPSGDPEPSAEDLEVTARLHEVGALVGIRLLDHVIAGDERFVSLRERMQLGSAVAGV